MRAWQPKTAAAKKATPTKAPAAAKKAPAKAKR
jgi:hypothetical protein